MTGGKQHEYGTDHHTKALRGSQRLRAVSGGLDGDAPVLHYRGPFRIYFNRKEDAPRVVSIDNASHSWEILCKTVKIERIDLRSKYEASQEYPNPKFTLEGVGWIQVDMNGVATIS